MQYLTNKARLAQLVERKALNLVVARWAICINRFLFYFFLIDLMGYRDIIRANCWAHKRGG